MATRTEQLIVRSVNDLVAAVTRLVQSVSAAAVTAAPAGPQVPKSEKLRAAIKAHWAGMSKAEHEARVRRMLAARGLKPKAPKKPPTPAEIAKKAAEKSARLRKAVAAHWKRMSRTERQARVRRMLAGRGLKPAAK